MNITPLDQDTASMSYPNEQKGEEMANVKAAPNELPRVSDSTDGFSKLGKSQKQQKSDKSDDSVEKMTVKKKRRKKKWKKPKDKPNRPLSAYNLFFQSERANMLGDDAPSQEDEMMKKRVHCKTHGKIGFAEMAKAIGNKWKSLDASSRKVYEEQAQKEKERYAVELANWKEAQKAKGPEEEFTGGQDPLLGAAIHSNNFDVGRASANPPNAVQAPSDTFRFMMPDDQQRRNLSFFQQRSQDLPFEYLRALQERQMDASALLGRNPLEAPLVEYPSAAEASANAILQQFQAGRKQGTQHQQTSTQPSQQQLLSNSQQQLLSNSQQQLLSNSQQQLLSNSQQQLLSSSRDLDHLQTLARYPNVAAAAAVRRIQQQYLGGEYGYSGNDFPFNIR